ncbi:hypothetical protein EDC01DRAFT_746301 [Geopyxis carbonaria]|nr:hypothetical protein EDC01DRAFT_746301 [Geopyxis carbonaria]
MRSIVATVSAAAVVAVAGAAETLAPFKYGELPLGTVQPLGWLKDELDLSAAGLAGHEWDFYRLVRNSTWTGGTWEYSGLRESAPYWFNYIVPLAWTLNDARLKAQATAFLDHVLETQWEDGWLGPEETPAQRGLWARSLLIYGMTQYADAEPAAADRIVTALHRFVNLAETMLAANYTGLLLPETNDFGGGNHGKTRAHELPSALQWLYEKHPRGNEASIWRVMTLMFDGGIAAGRDWRTFFVDGVFPTAGWPDIADTRFVHGVDVSEGLRWTTAKYRLDKDPKNAELAATGFDLVFKYHGAASGAITADESLAGLSPARGSELCMAVETMFSAAYLYRFHGLNRFADRVEQVAFNAFPAQMTGDHWGHQYVTQVNQPWAMKTEKEQYANVGVYGTKYGLEPNYPCCTVNHPQGFPKFTASSWMTTGTSGLVHALLSPSTLTTTLASGATVTVRAVTNYPFSGTLHYTATASAAFTLYLRIPTWADLPTSHLNSAPLSPNATTGLHAVRVPAGTTTLTLVLGQRIRVERRKNDAVAVHRGPLLYAVTLPYNASSFTSTWYNDAETPLPAEQLYAPHPLRDQYFTPRESGSWKVAINTTSLEFVDEGGALVKGVFGEGKPPLKMTVQACRVEWSQDGGIVGETPAGECVGGVEERVLRPFGSTKVRMGEVPEMV